MTLRAGAAWLLSALLLLQVPGSLALSGPRTVTGTVGGSLSVQCPYEEEYTESIKYWCKSPCLLWRQNIVQTTESKREVTRGRVSIRDHPANLTFTVTLENLTEDNEGTYGCGIHVSLYPDPTFWVKVSVFPGSTEAPSWKVFTSSLDPPFSLPETPNFSQHLPETPDSTEHPPEMPNSSQHLPEMPDSTQHPPETPDSSQHPPEMPNSTQHPPEMPDSSQHPPEMPDSSQHPRSLLHSAHFLLLVFLKLPLLLSMLSAVLWVNRPPGSSRGRRSQPNYENQ